MAIGWPLNIIVDEVEQNNVQIMYNMLDVKASSINIHLKEKCAQFAVLTCIWCGSSFPVGFKSRIKQVYKSVYSHSKII